MPATYTHAVYGEWVYQKLSEPIRALIQQHRELYDIGLSGPDILFFYRPLCKNAVKSLGYGMHQISARPFFVEARYCIEKSQQPLAALAYILGFINHFVLDSQCHPIINKIVRETPISHSELESELDTHLLRKQGKSPIATKVTTHIIPSQKNAEIIAPFFGISVSEQKEALSSMVRYLDLFIAPTKLKRSVIFNVMKLVGQYENYHGLVFNEQPVGEYIPTIEMLEKKMQEAVEISVRLIEEYIATLQTYESLDARYDCNYE